MALRTKGETVDEIDGLARTMLEFANPVGAAARPSIDTCGTGGDRSGTFNISTIAAIVVAGAGVPVAKHGNRAASSHCGSADLLEALGVQDRPRRDGRRSGAWPRRGSRSCSRRCSIPAMGHAGPVRRELRVPTVFNFLGPLTNPARPFAQVVGVSDERMLPLMAEVLARRGVRAKVFRGEDGLDELTTTGISTVFDVRERRRPGDAPRPGDARAGAGHARRPAGRGRGDAARRSRARCWTGEPGPRRDVVLLNAAAALEVAGRGLASSPKAWSWRRGSIDPGAARRRRSSGGSRSSNACRPGSISAPMILSDRRSARSSPPAGS